MSRSINTLNSHPAFTADFLTSPLSPSRTAQQIGWFFTALKYANSPQIANNGASRQEWKDHRAQDQISAYWAQATRYAENGLVLGTATGIGLLYLALCYLTK